MTKYLSLIADTYLKQQPDGARMVYVLDNFWEEVGVNESAFEILKKLDGKHTLEMIVDELSEHFREKKERAFSIVSNFIDVLEEKKLIKATDVHCNYSLNIKGSREYFVPDAMILELTYNCPLKCKHCYANAGVGASMDIDKLLPLLSSLNHLGTNYFQLTGGEPFAYPYIEEVIDLLLVKKIKFSITTSGFYWNKRIKRILNKLEGKKIAIQVSLDGLSNTHNFIRGNIESYANAVHFLKEAISRDISTSVATCLIQQDWSEIEELCAYLKQLGVHQHRLGTITNLGRATDNQISSQISAEELQNFTVYLKSKFETEQFHIGPIEECDNTECTTIDNCGAGYRFYSLTPYFTLFPCTIFKVNVGNLNRETLEDVFIRNSQLFSGMRSPSDNICGTCKLLDICKNCFAEGNLNKNKVRSCHWYEEEYKNKSIILNECSF